MSKIRDRHVEQILKLLRYPQILDHAFRLIAEMPIDRERLLRIDM